jgi:hypothetical protein
MMTMSYEAWMEFHFQAQAKRRLLRAFWECWGG